jgi:hypothetical protein
MAYDKELAHRIRAAIADRVPVDEQAMFGGLGFMAHGNMAIAASGQGGLMVRVDPADADTLVDGVGVTRMEMHGRAMDGGQRVTPEAVEADDVLLAWVDRGLARAAALPRKG